jgi:hypothetical protein
VEAAGPRNVEAAGARDVEAAGAQDVEAAGAWDVEAAGVWDIDALPEAAFLLSRQSRLCSEIIAALLKRRIELPGLS